MRVVEIEFYEAEPKQAAALTIPNNTFDLKIFSLALLALAFAAWTCSGVVGRCLQSWMHRGDQSLAFGCGEDFVKKPGAKPFDGKPLI